MALFDASLEFSDDQDASQSAGTLAASNTFCFSDTTQELTGLEMGAGQPMWFNCKVGTEAVAATSGSTAGACTFVVSLVNESDTTIDSSSETMYTSRTFTEDELTAGAWLVKIPLPYDIDKQAYMGVLYTVGGATSAVGTVDAWIDNGSQSSFDTQVSASNI